MCGPKEYRFSAVLVINRVSLLAIVFKNRVWFLHSNLEVVMFLEEATRFFIIIDKIINKSNHKFCFGQLYQPQLLN